MRDISKIIVERSAACSAWPAGLDAALSQRGYGFQRTNAAALNLYQLYRRAGFEESSIYHYRTATPRALTIASCASDTYWASIRRRARSSRDVAVRHSCWFPTHH